MRFWFFYYLESEGKAKTRVHDFWDSESGAIDEVRQMQLCNLDICPLALVRVVKDFGNIFGKRKTKRSSVDTKKIAKALGADEVIPVSGIAEGLNLFLRRHQRKE